MDAFYASVEQRDEPAYRGKPLAVGGSSKRGVVAAASYEAREFGVKSAMPSVIAARKCPDLIFVKPRFEVYREVSSQIREIFYDYTDLVEPLSLDEAYLDVTHNKKKMESATLIAGEIRKRIREKLQLTASAGVSINKFLAKVASDLDKPDGLSVIAPDQVEGFIDQLSVSKFFGVGKVTAQRMKELGIHTGRELKTWEEADLVKEFGKHGHYFYKISRGEDDRPVNPERVRKSVSTERTFEEDLTDLEDMEAKLITLAEQLQSWSEKHDVYGRTVTLKIKFNDFRQITRSKTFQHEVRDLELLELTILELLRQADPKQGVRLLGAGVSNLNNVEDQESQLTLNF